MSQGLRALAVLGLVGANAFFVIGEYAVITSRRAVLRQRAEAGDAGARAALRLLEDPVRVMSTVQVGITATGILIGAVGEPLVRRLLGGGIGGGLAFLIAFSVVTYLSVVFGELVPKALTLDRSEALASRVAPALEVIAHVARPIVWLLRGSASVVLRPFGVRRVVAGESVRSPADLRAIVDEAEASGVIPRSQEELLDNVFKFAGREVRDVMVPTNAVDWLEAELTVDDALDHVLRAPHERYPVARGSLNRLAGIVHVRDLIAGARRGSTAAVGELARPAMVVPETRDLGSVLRQMREQREQLAVVVDEYGAVSGIVTLEDVLEELVGEIQDEFDLTDARITWLDERTVRVPGSITVEDFNEMVAGAHLPEDGPRTLGGLVLHGLGHQPKPGDTVAVDGAMIRVDAVDGLRVSRVAVILGNGAPSVREQRTEAKT